MKILITGCSWVQRMDKQNYPKDIDIDLKSFGGQGLWTIESHLKGIQKDTFDFIFVQLPTPVRNEINSVSTTEKFNEFIGDIKKMGEKVAANKWLTEYKQKIIDITGQVIEIPQQGTKHSINVSVVSGILCWDFYLKINS